MQSCKGFAGKHWQIKDYEKTLFLSPLFRGIDKPVYQRIILNVRKSQSEAFL